MCDIVKELFTHELTVEEYKQIIEHCSEQLGRLTINCVYCPEYKAVYSESCQGYMDYCKRLKKKINVYEDCKSCKDVFP